MHGALAAVVATVACGLAGALFSLAVGLATAPRPGSGPSLTFDLCVTL
jgi:hypothetical protein